MFSLEWVERRLKPFVNKDTGKFILFLNNLSAHVDSDFQVVWLGLENPEQLIC